LLFAEGALAYVIRSGTAGKFVWPESGALDELEMAQRLMQHFGSLPRSFVSLFQAITGGDDWRQVYNAVEPMGAMYRLLFLLFVVYFVTAVMNIVTAAFVESMIEASQSNRRMMVEGELKTKEEFLRNMRRIFSEADRDGDGLISLEDLHVLMQDPQEAAYFSALGVEVAQVRQLFLLLDADKSQTISRREFLQGCFRLRGNAKSVDVAVLQNQLDVIEDNIRSIGDALSGLLAGTTSASPRGSSRSKSQNVVERCPDTVSPLSTPPAANYVHDTQAWTS